MGISPLTFLHEPSAVGITRARRSCYVQGMPGRTYSDAEVQEILRRAVEQSAGGSDGEAGGLTREELIDAARDAGIDPSAVEDAIGSLERDRDVRAEIAALRKRERRGLASNFVTWAIITAGLLALRFFGEGGWWFVWPMGVWMVLLLLRLKGFIFESPEHARERAERKLEHRRRQRKRRDGHIDHRRVSEANPEVERGVEKLLDAAARRSGKAAAARFRAPDGSEHAASAASGNEDARAEEPDLRGRSRS
jgi:hypothetical protein